MNPDGIAYLDMGEAYLRGDWGMAISAYWSPFYAWLLGLGMRVLSPAMRWEFPVVHVINFLIYLAALACFEFFWRELTRYRSSKGSGDGSISFPDWGWWLIGYSLFIWSSLNLIELWSVTPDMCVAALVYLAAGFIVRIRAGTGSWRTYALLGGVLGLGYLSKAVMLPLALVFLVVGLFSGGNLRRGRSLAPIALISFILVASPFVIALSQSKGRLAFGDSGKLNYARFINGLPDVHWQGDVPGNGTPVHPTRKVFDTPAIYEFATPIGGTYPPWYDPSYWYEGVTLQLDLAQQGGVLLANTLFYLELFFREQAGLMVAVLIAYLLGQPRSLRLKDAMRQWGLVVPALAALGLYALVYVETRYLGPFVVLLWGDLLANVRLPNSQTMRKLAALLPAIMVLFMLANILAFNLEGFRDLADRRDPAQRAGVQAAPPSWPGEVAEELVRLGIEPGSRVAVIGYAFDSYWARLARLRIVAEMSGSEADPFYLGSPAFQSQVIAAFASTGAGAIVAEKVPGYASLAGWQRVGDSNYYILSLSP